MPIWKLTPIDLDDPNWESSSHRGLVVVRAPNEGSAREVAEKAFGVPTRFPPGKAMRVPPWMRSELVRAEIIDSPIYPAEGPTEVLEPFFKEGE
jgi:hypothetical protein